MVCVRRLVARQMQAYRRDYKLNRFFSIVFRLKTAQLPRPVHSSSTRIENLIKQEVSDESLWIPAMFFTNNHHAATFTSDAT